MLELFPEGVEQSEQDGLVELSGYAEQAPAEGLEDEPVEDGWDDAWRDFHRPVRDGRLWIGPPWFEPEPHRAVVIDPGRAFGTGAHGSTRAALALLRELEPSPALDLGCGSGVLSIAALRLGFGPLQAFDIDPLAVQATRSNAERKRRRGAGGRAARRAGRPAAGGAAVAGQPRAAPARAAAASAPTCRRWCSPRACSSRRRWAATRRVVVDGWAAELVER